MVLAAGAEPVAAVAVHAHLRSTRDHHSRVKNPGLRCWRTPPHLDLTTVLLSHISHCSERAKKKKKRKETRTILFKTGNRGGFRLKA